MMNLLSNKNKTSFKRLLGLVFALSIASTSGLMGAKRVPKLDEAAVKVCFNKIYGNFDSWAKRPRTMDNITICQNPNLVLNFTPENIKLKHEKRVLQTVKPSATATKSKIQFDEWINKGIKNIQSPTQPKQQARRSKANKKQVSNGAKPRSTNAQQQQVTQPIVEPKQTEQPQQQDSSAAPQPIHQPTEKHEQDEVHSQEMQQNPNTAVADEITKVQDQNPTEQSQESIQHTPTPPLTTTTTNEVKQPEEPAQTENDIQPQIEEHSEQDSNTSDATQAETEDNNKSTKPSKTSYSWIPATAVASLRSIAVTADQWAKYHKTQSKQKTIAADLLRISDDAIYAFISDTNLIAKLNNTAWIAYDMLNIYKELHKKKIRTLEDVEEKLKNIPNQAPKQENIDAKQYFINYTLPYIVLPAIEDLAAVLRGYNINNTKVAEYCSFAISVARITSEVIEPKRNKSNKSIVTLGCIAIITLINLVNLHTSKTVIKTEI